MWLRENPAQKRITQIIEIPSLNKLRFKIRTVKLLREEWTWLRLRAGTVISEVLVFFYYCLNFERFYIAARTQAEVINIFMILLSPCTQILRQNFKWDHSCFLAHQFEFKKFTTMQTFDAIFVLLKACLNKLRVQNKRLVVVTILKNPLYPKVISLSSSWPL